jgi:phenylacetate-CoA ligase
MQAPFTTRADLAAWALTSGERRVRETRSAGTVGPVLRWRDTRADLGRRAAAWQRALGEAGVDADDRVLLAVPLRLAVAWDCSAALLEAGVLCSASDSLDASTLESFEPTVVVCTPSDALRLRRHPRTGIELIVVTGEPGGSIASTARRIEHSLGARCLDAYAVTELGLVGWSCALGQLHLDEACFAIESIEPAGEAARAAGELGELVLSARGERDAPLRRYRTGDLVRVGAGPCGCGRAQPRAIGGVLGRLGARLLVRGVELVPSTIEDVVFRHPAVADYHLVVYDVRGKCAVNVQIAVDEAVASEGDRARVAAEVAEDLRRSIGVRLQCDVVASSSLPGLDVNRRSSRVSVQ